MQLVNNVKNTVHFNQNIEGYADTLYTSYGRGTADASYVPAIATMDDLLLAIEASGYGVCCDLD